MNDATSPGPATPTVSQPIGVAMRIRHSLFVVPGLLALALPAQSAPPAGWRSCGTFPALSVDPSAPSDGHRSLSLVALDDRSIGCAVQDVPVERLRGLTVRLWSVLRGQVTGIRGGLWIRVVSPSRGEEYRDLAGVAAEIGLDWRPFQVHLFVPQDATILQIGAVVVGPRGALWVDRVHLDPVPASDATGPWSPSADEVVASSPYPANASFEQ